MGWWSPTIMGGDTPCDILMGFENVAYANLHPMDEDATYPIETLRAAIESQLPAIMVQATNIEEEWDEPYVTWHTLAYFLMSHGCAFTEELRTRLVESFDEPTYESGWREPEKRQACLDAAKQQVLDYDISGGTVVEFDNEGLFDVIADTVTKVPVTLPEKIINEVVEQLHFKVVEQLRYQLTYRCNTTTYPKYAERWDDMYDVMSEMPTNDLLTIVGIDNVILNRHNLVSILDNITIEQLYSEEGWLDVVGNYITQHESHLIVLWDHVYNQITQ